MNHYGLVIVLVPSSASNLHKFFLYLPKLRENIDKLKPLFCKVFRENSVRLRTQLFSNELMRYIWRRFTLDEGAAIKSYISKLRAAIPYQGQAETLI